MIGARGREGKTTVVVGVAVATTIEHSMGQLNPPTNRRVVIYSAEDDRRQYARKIAAQVSLLGAQQAELVKRRILVPDLDSPDLASIRALVTVHDRNPITTGTDVALIEAIEPLMWSDEPPILLVFETASTLSDADEDNRSHKMLIACLKRIARALNVAVVLVHHTSQAADNNLADLNVSTADIRGGTALVYNSRQNLMLVNLGSDIDPFPDSDARTVLRGLVAGAEDGRITAQAGMFWNCNKNKESYDQCYLGMLTRKEAAKWELLGEKVRYLTKVDHYIRFQAPPKSKTFNCGGPYKRKA